MGLCRFFWVCALAITVSGASGLAFGQSPISFPWNCAKNTAPTQQHGPAPVYRTLGKVSGPDIQPQPVVLEAMPAQEAYAYGWFGSNPAPIWNRHLGYYKSFTQWSEY